MARYDRHLREVIRRVREALPNVAIMVVSPMDRGTMKGGRVVTLPAIPKIVEMQRRVALESNCAFFSLFNAMGGEGTTRAEAEIIPGPLALYQEMLRRLDSVEEALAALSGVRAGIGHNKPPEPIEFIAFDNDEQAIKVAISIVRALPPVPEAAPLEARKAADEFARIATKTKPMPQSKATISFQKSSRQAPTQQQQR
jgi:hypothetical protein